MKHIAFLLAFTFAALAQQQQQESNPEPVQRKLPPIALSSVHKIYVGSLGNEDGAEAIRQSIIVHLIQSGKLTIADTPEEADAVLSGLGGQKEMQFYRYGAVGASANASGGTTHSASAIVQLRDRSGNILWATETTSGMFRGLFSKTETATAKAARLVTEQLLKALEKARKGY
jgi:hypothetical protein